MRSRWRVALLSGLCATASAAVASEGLVDARA